MKRHENGPRGAMVLSLMLSLVLGAAAARAAAEPGHGAPADGIKVHGHWTLEIRNADGTLASRHEFENALIPTMGSPLLAGLLSNLYVDAAWGIRLWGDPSPCHPGTNQNPCEIGQPALVVTVPMTPGSPGSPSGTLELSGSVTMVDNSRLFNVNTIWSAQIRGTLSRQGNQFSERQINIPVLRGQIVQIKVVFSFS